MNSLKNNYLISVIIPTHNREGVLKKSIDSVINQSIGFENIELIIVDDASTDKITKKTLLKYQSEYPDNIKPIFLKENSGYPGKTRNIGINYSTGKYIVFSDDDDYYLENGLELLYNAIEEYDSDMVMFDHYEKNEKGYKLSFMKKHHNDIINMYPLIQENFNLLININIGYCWGNIYKKDFITNHNIEFLDNTPVSEDIYFYYNVIKHAHKITIIPNTEIYVHNIYSKSTSQTHTMERFDYQLKTIYYINYLIKDLNIDISPVLRRETSILLGFLTMLNDNESKREAALKIYNFEKKLDKEFNFKNDSNKIELRLLENAIMKKKFKKAIFLSNIYNSLYNNATIQKLYRKLRIPKYD